MIFSFGNYVLLPLDRKNKSFVSVVMKTAGLQLAQHKPFVSYFGPGGIKGLITSPATFCGFTKSQSF